MPISNYLKNLRRHVGHDSILIPGAAAIIRNGEGKILLQQRSDNSLWGLPGGSTDPGESPAQTVVREVYEETGLRVKPERLLGLLGGKVHTHPNGDQTEMTIAIFACRIVGGTLASLDGESVRLEFFSSDEFPKSAMLEKYPKALFERPQDTLFEWDDQWLQTLHDQKV